PALVLVIAFVWALVFKAISEDKKPEDGSTLVLNGTYDGPVFTFGADDGSSGETTTNVQELLHQTNDPTSASLTVQEQPATDKPEEERTTEKQESTTYHNYANVVRSGTYTSRDEVAKYIKLYKTLPSNYITSARAKGLGWKEADGNLADVAPGKSIGGDSFDDPEKLLPSIAGRSWKQCDLNYVSGLRGAEYLVNSNDGLVFYTADHYKTFTQLY
ncbi:MAG: hypothetical protein GX851_01285, partial [Clostridiales bacterium]|nr:hypothetical protein [Clostridiales bacterium]